MRSYFLETVFTENTKTDMNANIRPLTASTQQTALMATSLKEKFLKYVWPFYNIMHERVNHDMWLPE